ncbi:Pol polyprotein [Elysia marginata]|uniref:Pol polyprotein n=1 Tax=Elysia marginata TaxID=1093978 RepID=A0AAV4G5A0_9GAST|nr:Pol polyprotein [Elysia marginata]
MPRLAGVWACESFDKYLKSLDSINLNSDHKPLIPPLNTKDLSETPLRCQRLLTRLMRYDPSAEYRQRKSMVTSDTLSRSPQAENGEQSA